MALGAFPFFGAIFELALVDVFVAVGAIREEQSLLEVAIHVASDTANLVMLTEQWIFCLGMIETKAGQKILPSPRGVAIFAALLERTFVRIGVTIRARPETHIPESRRTSRDIGLVALFAGYFDMQPGQRIARFGMVEVFRGLPIADVVTGLASIPELAFVRVRVAGQAFLGES